MIQFYHVHKSYDGRQQAIRDVSFRVDKGEFVFLTGPSGAGKTTILKLILCAETADDGQILIAGRNVAKLGQRDIPGLRRQIGVVFQDFKLIDRKTTHALKSVGILAKKDSYPPRLSGGEQQRVAIARALAKDPVILLADEPTGNLDQKTTLEIMDIIKNIHAQGTTVLMATHNLGLTMSLGKRMVHIEDGRVEE